MFATFSRSWSLTTTSFEVLKKDPELLAFPVLSSFFSLLLLALVFVPTILTSVLESGGGGLSLVFGGIEVVLAFFTYFVLAFLSTFFNVCVVYTAKKRFEGGNSTFFEAIGFALSRTPQIAAWSAVSATVGLMLRWLDGLAEQKGIVGMIFGILQGVIGFAWAIVQLFVIPAMVYEDLGPFAAMKRSVETLKSTWGESLVRHYGLGFLQFLAMLPWIGLVFFGFYSFSIALPVGGAVLAVAVVGLIATFTVFSVLNTIYNTALYHFASTGTIPSGFEDEPLELAFTPRHG